VRKCTGMGHDETKMSIEPHMFHDTLHDQWGRKGVSGVRYLQQCFHRLGGRCFGAQAHRWGLLLYVLYNGFTMICEGRGHDTALLRRLDASLLRLVVSGTTLSWKSRSLNTTHTCLRNRKFTGKSISISTVYISPKINARTAVVAYINTRPYNAQLAVANGPLPKVVM